MVVWGWFSCTWEFREFENEGGEGDRAVDRDDSSVATDITELVVVGAGEDLAAKTAHEADARRRVVEMVGARGGGDGVGV